MMEGSSRKAEGRQDGEEGREQARSKDELRTTTQYAVADVFILEHGIPH
jgi:hypothetical protein